MLNTDHIHFWSLELDTWNIFFCLQFPFFFLVARPVLVLSFVIVENSHTSHINKFDVREKKASGVANLWNIFSLPQTQHNSYTSSLTNHLLNWQTPTLAFLQNLLQWEVQNTFIHQNI